MFVSDAARTFRASFVLQHPWLKLGGRVPISGPGMALCSSRSKRPSRARCPLQSPSPMNLRVAILRAYTGAFRTVSGFLARKLSHNFYLHLAGLFSLFALVDVLFLHQGHAPEVLRPGGEEPHVKPAPDPQIVVVDIDEKSLAAMAKEYGRWPWPRQVLGEFVESLSQQGPKAVVFDVLFSDPDVFNPDSDAYFNEVIAATPNVFFPYSRLPAKDDGLSQVTPEMIPGAVKTPAAESGKTAAVVLPYFKAITESGRLGTFNIDPDADGIVRAYLVWLDAHGWRLPSLPARVGQELGDEMPQRQSILLNWRGKPFSYRYRELQRRVLRHAEQGEESRTSSRTRSC